MSEVALSIVFPAYNEAGVLEELVRRCRLAAESTGRTFEVIIADDGSRDATPEIAKRLENEGLARHLRLEPNRGQFGATQAGLGATRGELVVVLDGDLQDPPEVIPSLVRAMDESADVVFAVKAKRSDPAWFRIGRAGYHVLQRLGKSRVPSGAGSFCVMRGELARKVARLPKQRSNLSAVLMALGAKARTVPYEKAARYDGESRVGPVGLAREALASLVLTGSLARICFAAALLLCVMFHPVHSPPYALLVGVPAFIDLGFVLRRRARRLLEPVPE